MNLEIPNKPKPYLMAHRGNNVLCPENTLGAFKQAVSDGADIIETDLHLSKDGHFICIHDATTNRTTGKEGVIADLTLAQIKEYNPAAYHPLAKKPEKILTLDELLEVIPENIVLALELKADAFCEQKTARQLVKLLELHDLLSHTWILSFHMEHLRAIQSVTDNIPVGLISMGRLKPPENLNVLGVFFPFVLLNPGIIKQAHKKGQLFCPLDTQPDKRLKFYKKHHVDAIISDNPQETRKAIDTIFFNKQKSRNI